MQININIEKKHLLYLFLFVAISLVVYVKAAPVTNTVPNPGHSAATVGSGVFGSAASPAETDAYSFPGDLGIGTNDPQGRLHVTGGRVRFNSSNGESLTYDTNGDLILDSSVYSLKLAVTDSGTEINSPYTDLDLISEPGSIKLSAANQIILQTDTTLWGDLTIGDHSAQSSLVSDPGGSPLGKNLCGITGGSYDLICPSGYFAVGIHVEEIGGANTCYVVKPVCAKN